MKYFLLSITVLILAGISLTASQEETRYYVVPIENADLIHEASRIRMTGEKFHIVSMRPGEVRDFSKDLHKKRNTCGGYMDVTSDVKEFGMEQALINASQPVLPLIAFDKVQTTYPTQVQAVLNKIDKNRYWDFLKKLSSFDNRHSTTQEGVKAADWLANHAQTLATAYGANVVITKVATGVGTKYVQPSVVVKLVGTNSTLPGVLMGGHMDTQGGGLMGGPLNNKPGADDDGSGTSTVMEVYNAILESGLKFERDLYFAFYAAEEVGLVGSQYVVADLMKKASFRGVVQFDMTGFQSKAATKDIYFITDNVDPQLTDFLKTLTVEYVKIAPEMIGDTKCGYACSDHARWFQKGVSAAFPSEADFNNMNKALHTSNDLMTIMSLDHALKFIKLGAAFAVESGDPL